jgi:hypothetical protein
LTLFEELQLTFVRHKQDKLEAKTVTQNNLEPTYYIHMMHKAIVLSEDLMNTEMPDLITQPQGSNLAFSY